MGTNSTLMHNNPITPNDPVLCVIGVDGASAYHVRKHGSQWRTTVKVEKSKALDCGRHPCGVCYPRGDKAYTDHRGF